MLPRLLRPLRPALRATTIPRPALRPSALPAARSYYWGQSPREWWRRFRWEVDLDNPTVPLLMVLLPYLGVKVYYAIKARREQAPKTNAFGDVVVRDGEEETYGPPETKIPPPPAAPWNPPGVSDGPRKPPHGHPAIEWPLLSEKEQV